VPAAASLSPRHTCLNCVSHAKCGPPGGAKPRLPIIKAESSSRLGCGNADRSTARRAISADSGMSSRTMSGRAALPGNPSGIEAIDLSKVEPFASKGRAFDPWSDLSNPGRAFSPRSRSCRCPLAGQCQEIGAACSATLPSNLLQNHRP
jgi:hypothetical protein